MPVKTCPQCGKEFSRPPSKNREHCSIACRKAATQASYIRPCAACGKPFTDRHSGSRYCSDTCRGITRRTLESRTCDTCGKEFRLKGNERFCSRECYRNRILPLSTKRETRQCAHCGAGFDVYKYRPTQYCSRKCHYADAQKPESYINLHCETCGKAYTVGRFFAINRHSRFCSRECQYSAYSRERQGAGNVNYRGGSVQYRGANWRRQSRLARVRDGYRCQICRRKIGVKRHDHGVHHIIGYRTFNDDWKRANELSNLITLCASCHARVEHGELPCPRPLL